ncbi:histidine phosphatase superfamily [Scenedesmus sp. NREL 46B-D3]|nr:histidine phosphatase superfamily [Scenedesmus sp. NREL 46B-D3]
MFGAATVYLIRHGEGWHNIGFEHHVDAHLTPRGWAQTAALQQHLAALQPQLDVELVVVSPLRRTLETAAGVFGALAPPGAPHAAATAAAGAAAAAAGDATDLADSSNSSWVWMHPQQQKATEVSRRAVIYLPAAGAAAAAAAAAACGNQGMGSSTVGSAGCTGSAATGQQQQQQQQQHVPLRIVAHEGCRERIGPNICDSFRDIPLQAADFPGVDFSLVRNPTDKVWAALHDAPARDGGCYSSGEEEAATEQRALELLEEQGGRPESRIAVVSHCGFLAHGMRALGRTMLSTCAASSNAGTAGVTDSVAGDSMQLLSNADGVMDIYDNGTGGKAAISKTSTTAVAPQLAEQLRVAAGEVGGRMSIAWANCEMRSIQLGWAPAGVLQAGGGTAAAAAGGGGVGGFLWAAPGDVGEWWSGGAAGL